MSVWQAGCYKAGDVYVSTAAANGNDDSMAAVCADTTKNAACDAAAAAAATTTATTASSAAAIADSIISTIAASNRAHHHAESLVSYQGSSRLCLHHGFSCSLWLGCYSQGNRSTADLNPISHHGLGDNNPSLANQASL